MAKRKHTEAFATSLDKPRNYSAQGRLVAKRITDAKKSLASAFKLAKGFERQKLGRRLKTAASKKDEKEVSKVNSEIQILKSIDPVVTAENYLNKTLLRVKRIAESGLLPESVKEDKGESKDQVLVTILARLKKATPVREAINAVVEHVKKVLEIPESNDEGQVGSLAAKNNKIDGKEKKQSTLDDKKVTSRLETEQRQDADDDLLSGSESSMDFAVFDGRVAGSDEEGESSEDAKPNDEDLPPEETVVTRPSLKYLPDPDLSPSPPSSPSYSVGGSSGEELEPENSPTELPAEHNATTKSFKAGDTTFVPSLTLGGYWSGSEGASDLDEDVSPRKNRRGQRERQKIAELKYGSGAKHLQNQRSSRDIGWDLKKGATGGGGWKSEYRAGQRREFVDFRNQSLRNQDGKQVQKDHPKRDDEGKLHPSWEAAKKRKEEKAVPTFQGKKVVFD